MTAGMRKSIGEMTTMSRGAAAPTVKAAADASAIAESPYSS